VGQRLRRYVALARRFGLLGAVRQVREKLLSYVSLQARTIWWTLAARRLPSDRAILRQTEGEWPSLDHLAAHLRSKTSPAFLFSAGDQEDYVATLRERYPANGEDTLRRAEAICQHRFRFLGGDFEFGAEIDWHLDPQSGRSWPRDYFEKIGRWMWSERRLGDYKLPWELNRHQYFVTLGKAYWLTGDERYADECASQILSWIRCNPHGMGINWYSALEIGVRLIAWAWTLHFFRSSSRFLAKAGKPFLKSFYQQATFLRHHLSLDKEVRNNHIVGEAAALVFAGSLLPEFKDAAEWLRTGLRILEHELTLQTFSDGVNKEQATSYRRFVLDFLILVIVLARRGAVPASAQLELLFEKMLNHVMYTTMPNGGTPMIGDADDGRGYIFDEGADLRDSRDRLAAGAVLCERPDFKCVAQDFGEEAFWLLGPGGLRAFEQLECVVPREASFAFPQGGHYLVRDNWTKETDFLFVKCGPFGWGGDGFCAHSHCDLLSFVLCINGMPIIVDSGTYTYHGPWRDQFRLTAAHNTVMIDGHEQATPLSFFGWKDIPKAECLAWEGRRVVGTIQAAPGVRHRREMNHPEAGVWEITDNLQGEGVHDVSWFFHFAPDLSLCWSTASEYLVVQEGNSPCVTVLPPRDVAVRIESGWYSSGYGQKEPNPLLRATWQGRMPVGGVTFSWKFQYAGKAKEP
jgi:hypothetical protein